MSIPLEQARAVIANLNGPRLRNLFAQVHAKHVLEEVGEDEESFPQFARGLNDRVTFAAYGVMAAGCSIVEHGERAEGSAALEQGASLLQYVHGPRADESVASRFHVFVASMAFYTAGHYSRAFVAIRSVEQRTLAAKVVADFIRKDRSALVTSLNSILLRPDPNLEDQASLDEWAITVAIARAISLAFDFTLTGTIASLEAADEQLVNALTIAASENHWSWWWVVRLVRLMLGDLRDASPWVVLPPHFGPEQPDLLGEYIRVIAFNRLPVVELWHSQRAALPVTLDRENLGAVVNLRTSAGKTRVAEIAILQTLLMEPGARIVYLAPFRSLALEVEHALSATFGPLGHEVSHLYGGSRVSSADTELLAESAITIATPEKARALFRATPEVFAEVRLFILDEGHLIGASERYVRNELFVDHLRRLVRGTGARILVLSAVLPNASQLAEWVGGDPDNVARSSWKPSRERFGLLRWNGERVRIEWKGDAESFNPSFVESAPLGFGRRRNPFPLTKGEAVAAAAVRLSAIGPVMIFAGRAVSVPGLAEAVLLALGPTGAEYEWPTHEWRVFEAVCGEELEANAVELRAARVGVICHSNKLPAQVRLASEHLMRSKPPRIIVATTTLAQGVNVGIASVIIASPYISQKTIDKRDFWNICGRAGRAYVDHEGKVLYAIDDTGKAWQVSKDEKLARDYFDVEKTDRVESGLLHVIGLMKTIATRANVDFEVLIELAANNDFASMGDKAEACNFLCDLVDDELLAMHQDQSPNATEAEPRAWVEDVFRGSLAVLQARKGSETPTEEEVLSFLTARASSAIRRTPRNVRGAVVSSGLPLSVALRMNAEIEIFAQIAEAYHATKYSLRSLVDGLKRVEQWARLNAENVTGEMPPATDLDAIRAGWLSGTAMRQLTEHNDDANSISREVYGYQLPWIMHAAAQQLKVMGRQEAADSLARIALLVELGVGTELAAHLFLAGIRSRVAVTELAALKVEFGTTFHMVAGTLRNPEFIQQLLPLVSDATSDWLRMMVDDVARRKVRTVPHIPPFTIKGVKGVDVLHARTFGDDVYLTTVDGVTRVAVAVSPEWPFDKVADDPRIAFVRSGSSWVVELRDPRLERATQKNEPGSPGLTSVR